jgi:hypothetical protein
LKEDLAVNKAKSWTADPAKITMIDNALKKDLDTDSRVMNRNLQR